MSKFLKFDFKRQGRKNRGSLEIVNDMLSVALVKVRKTRIMYQANLSYRLMEKYLTSLLENGLLDCDENSFYVVTMKGMEFLKKYDDYVWRRRKIRDEITGIRNDRVLLRNMCLNNGNGTS